MGTWDLDLTPGERRQWQEWVEHVREDALKKIAGWPAW